MSDLEKILDFLNFLLQKRECWREEELLDLLKDEGYEIFGGWRSCDGVKLFRAHFTLFHLLYLLRDRLRNLEESDLEIHCLRICRIPLKKRDDAALDCYDPLREYYSDLQNLESTDRAAVERMLDSFWRAYSLREQKLKALAELELSENASQSEINARWRTLAMKYHPDKGGDPSKFRLIADAAAVLKRR